MKDCYKNENGDKDIASTFQAPCSYFLKIMLSCRNWSGHGLTGLTGSYGLEQLLLIPMHRFIPTQKDAIAIYNGTHARIMMLCPVFILKYSNV